MSITPPRGFTLDRPITPPRGFVLDTQPTPQLAYFRRGIPDRRAGIEFAKEFYGTTLPKFGAETIGPIGPTMIAGGVGERVFGQVAGEVTRRVGTRIAPVVSAVRKAVQRKPAAIPVPRVATFTPQEVAQEASRIGSTDTVAAHQRLIAQSQGAVPRGVLIAKEPYAGGFKLPTPAERITAINTIGVDPIGERFLFHVSEETMYRPGGLSPRGGVGDVLHLSANGPTIRNGTVFAIDRTMLDLSKLRATKGPGAFYTYGDTIPESAMLNLGKRVSTEKFPVYERIARAIKLEVPSRIGPTPAGVVATPEAIVKPVIAQAPHAKIVATAEELFTKAGIQRNPKLLISDQVTDLMLSGQLQVEDIAATLKANGLSWADFSTGIFRPSVKNAAQTLGRLGQLSQRVGRFLGKNESDELAEIGSKVDEMLALRPLWKRVTVDLWRRMLVTQPATAARNAVTQVGRVGLDIIQRGVDQGLQVGVNGLRRVAGRPTIPITARPLEGWQTLLNIFKRPRVNKREVEALLQSFPDDYDRLFGTYLSDISTKIQRSGMPGRAERIVVGAEKGAELLNTLNRGQEFLVRRGVFQATLETRLLQKGTSIARVVAENAIGAIDPADIAAAVDKSLELSFARSPKYGTIGAEFIRAVNRFAPITTQAIPFPRFLVNALQFYYDFSPLGFVRLLNPTQLRAIAGGNTQVLSRAIIGTGILGAAYQLRKSQYAGERWYELKVGGRTLDTRAYNPVAPYLFVADIIKRYQDGTLYELDAKDILAATLGANIRAGTGLYLADKIVQALTRSGEPEKTLRFIKTIGGEYVSGFLTPVRALSDVLGQLEQWVKGTEELSTVREERVEPFTGPIKAAIPWLSQTLPEAESPTQAGPLVRQAPLLRQLTGISVAREKNPFQAELDRLQFTYRDILPSRGDPEADRLIAKQMGPLVEKFGVAVVKSAGYQRLSNDQKRFVLRRVLAQIRQQAIQLATQENPALFARLRFQSLPKDERRLLQPLRR